MYPDVEVALLEYLAPAGRTVTQLMEWSPDKLPAIRIQRVGGGEAGEDVDNPRVVISCYAIPTSANPRASQDVARAVIDLMKNISGTFVAGTLLESATKDSGPVSRPWDDPEVRVTELIYSVLVRD